MQRLSSLCPWHVSSAASAAWLGFGAVVLKNLELALLDC